jgi:hypothetical protein
MARQLRIEYPGAVYHITSRGNDKKTVFKDDTDREPFISTLVHVNKRSHSSRKERYNKLFAELLKYTHAKNGNKTRRYQAGT